MDKSFVQWIKNNWRRHDLCPPELDPQDAIHFLCDYLLGEDWYTPLPINGKQANTEIVAAILLKHSRKYRKEVKKAKKERENK